MALDRHDLLRAVPLFRRVPEADLGTMADLVRERRQPKGSLILTQGDEGEALFLIRIGQTHASIGQMVGASRETVSRTMRNLVLRNVIGVTRKGITLLDLPALRLAAQQAA